MLQLDNSFEKIIPFTIVVLISILFYLVSIEANELQRQISGSSGFLNFLYSMNNFVAFLLPILAFTFFTITIKFMLFIYDVELRKHYMYQLVSYSLIPILVFMTFYLINLVFFQQEMTFQSIEDILNIKFMLNLTFNDLKIISEFCWVLVYILLIVQLVEKAKISIVKSVLIVVTPSLVVFILRYIFSKTF